MTCIHMSTKQELQYLPTLKEVAAVCYFLAIIHMITNVLPSPFNKVKKKSYSGSLYGAPFCVTLQR